MPKYLIDENGNIVNEMYVGDRILRNTSTEAFKNSVKVNEGVSFVKLYINNLTEIIDLLTDPQVVTMLRLLPYIQYGSGFLINTNQMPLTRDSIMKILDKNERNTDRDLDGLVKAQLLGKHRSGKFITYTVNPYVFCLGAKVFKVLNKGFAKTRWARGK